jgi:hypothetical protein
VAGGLLFRRRGDRRVGDVSSIVVAVVTTIGTIVVAAIAAGLVGRRRGTSAQAQAGKWRDQADLEKARAELLVEERDRERAGRLEAEAKLVDTRHDLDDCARQRDDLLSDLRLLTRRRTQRTTTP